MLSAQSAQRCSSLDQHSLFEPFTDPVSGAVSYLLKEVVAPIQQSMYYVNPSLTEDEQWLWMMTGWPPSPQRTLALVSLDAANPVVRHFPQAQFNTAQPLVAADGGIWFGNGPCIYKMDQLGKVDKVFTLPADFVRNRLLRRLATHLSLSSDGRYFLLDGQLGDSWFVGLAEVATGEFHLIREFEFNHNHAQFSPVQPDSFLIAQDHFSDPNSGEFFHHAQRTFLMNTQGTQYHCVNPSHQCRPYFGACHEWWSPDGWLCYIDYEAGAYEYNPESGETVHLWKEPLCHAHCSADRRLWCADESPYYWNERPCKILLFDRNSGRRVEIQSAMPAPFSEFSDTMGIYHIHPHPQFSPCDNWIVYTATNNNRTTVALASPFQDCH